ncbi:MAG: SDR family NAD(P)-dependent oxidoreductase, partial [Pseudomonadota bacterium]
MKPWRLDGQRALVTGGSRGIGLAVVRELLGLGADVAMVARDQRNLEWRASELAEAFPERQIRAFAIDLGYPESVGTVPQWLAEQWSSLDILVNNVGVNWLACGSAQHSWSRGLSRPGFYGQRP